MFCCGLSAVRGVCPDLQFYSRGTAVPSVAHRALLASYSPLLKSCFLGSDPGMLDVTAVILPDFETTDVETMLNFLYGQVSDSMNAPIFHVMSMSIANYPERNPNPLTETLVRIDRLQAESKEETSGRFGLDQRHGVIKKRKGAEENQAFSPTDNHNIGCSLCGLQFDLVKMLSKHVNSAHVMDQSPSGKTFQCKTCLLSGLPNSNYLNLTTLERHCEVRHLLDPQDLVTDCPDCLKPFNAKAMRLHIRTHTNCKPFHCLTCDWKTNWETSFRTHLKKCNKTPDRNPRCNNELKKKVPNTEAQTGQVEINIVIGESTYTVQCKRCGLICSNQEEYSSHLCSDSQHRKSKKFRCNRCLVDFKTMSAIRKHQEQCKSALKEKVTTEAEPYRTSKRLKKKPAKIKAFESEFDDPTGLSDDSDIDQDFVPTGKEEMESDDELNSSLDKEEKLYTVVDSSKRSDLRNNKRCHTCIYCEARFSRASQLRAHSRTHVSQLRTHSRTHVRSIQPACHQCNRHFLVENELKNHNCLMSRVEGVVESPSSGGAVKCELCGCQLGGQSELFHHTVSHLPRAVVAGLEPGLAGWCPHCPGPVPPHLADSHVAEHHS